MVRMPNLFSELNPAQAEAVQCTEGPVLILAGAGSGKTRTIVHRIAYLIAEKRVHPRNILAVTFTNKAAKEMNSRVTKLLGSMNIPRDSMPFIGTFHALCVKILRCEIGVLGYKTHFTIYDTSDQLACVKEVMWTLGIDTKQFSPQAVHHQISNAKNELVSPAKLASSANHPIAQTAARVYGEYQKRLHTHNALDFDDLIMKTVELFVKHKEVLKKYQMQFQYLLVDEYQDTNQAQYRLVTMLAKHHQNICVVGDDFQSIYSWRGANIRNILEFEKDYPSARVIKLEQNYRSTKHIVSAGNAVIAHNANQTKKNLWTSNPDGHLIRVVETQDERDESEFVVRDVLGVASAAPRAQDSEITYVPEEDPFSDSILDRVLRARKGYDSFKEKLRAPNLKSLGAGSRVKFSDYAVLYRTNAQSRAMEESLLRYGVPYQIVGGLKFYDRKEIKDILAYAQGLANPEDAVGVKRIVNVPARSIGDKTWERLYQFALTHRMPILDAACEAEKITGLPTRAVSSVKDFGELMQDLMRRAETLTPSEILDLIPRHSGYKELILDGTEEGDARWENIQELKTVARKFDDQIGLDGLRALLAEVALMSDIDSMQDERNSVTLMTMHAAKGLEFPHVYVIGAEEGLFPHARSLYEPSEMEEERRLAYVAITRAMRRLTLLYAAQRTVFGQVQVNSPSRFLADLPDDAVELLSSQNERVIQSM